MSPTPRARPLSKLANTLLNLVGLAVRTPDAPNPLGEVDLRHSVKGRQPPPPARAKRPQQDKTRFVVPVCEDKPPS